MNYLIYGLDSSFLWATVGFCLRSYCSSLLLRLRWPYLPYRLDDRAPRRHIHSIPLQYMLLAKGIKKFKGSSTFRTTNCCTTFTACMFQTTRLHRVNSLYVFIRTPLQAILARKGLLSLFKSTIT